MYKKYIVILILIGAVVLLFINIFIISNRKIITTSKAAIETRKLIGLQDFNSLLKQNLFYYYQNEALQLNNIVCFYGNDTLSKTRLFDIVNNECLVFYFSGFMCNSCIDFVITLLKQEFLDYSENKRIILLTYDIDPRLRDTFYDKKTLNIVTSSNLGIDEDLLIDPFFMVLDKGRKPRLIFIPDKRYRVLTGEYIGLIRKKLNI